MRIQMRYLAVAVLFALVAPPVVRAQDSQDNTEAASADPVATRVQRQDRVRVHQPAEGTAVRQRSEEQMRLEGTTGSRAETRQQARTRTGSQSSRNAAMQRQRIQARDNASASRVRNSTRQRARVHRPARP